MTWYVFETSNADPRAPGVCLGKIEIPPKIVNGIDENLRDFDLHLRANRRRAFGESYRHYCPNAYSDQPYLGFKPKTPAANTKQQNGGITQ